MIRVRYYVCRKQPSLRVPDDRNSFQFNCFCKDGFHDFGNGCIDIDECDTPHDFCSDVEICKNVEGSYICNCKAGYVQQNGTCVDLNECEADYCSPFASCNNSGQSHSILKTGMKIGFDHIQFAAMNSLLSSLKSDHTSVDVIMDV